MSLKEKGFTISIWADIHEVRDQLKNVTPREIIQALGKDGWTEELKRSASRGFSKNQNGQRRYLAIHYHPRKTYNVGYLSKLLEQEAGWSESGLRQLGLIKASGFFGTILHNPLILVLTLKQVIQQKEIQMGPLDEYIRKELNEHATKIGKLFEGSDVMAIFGPIIPGLEIEVRNAVKSFEDHNSSLVIVLDTIGGIVEVVERMVNVIRTHYNKVAFIVPNRAMSAGTVFVMSGDRILMDFFSCLGPIDPQLDRGDGGLIPALAYLNQYERLIKKSKCQDLTTAEVVLLNKLDLGELYKFEQAKELSMELLIEWLSQYKFKDWKKTEIRKKLVTPEMRRKRAKKIAKKLSDNNHWHSHGRGIHMKILIDELNLKIEDYSEIPELDSLVRAYYNLLKDYIMREDRVGIVHTKEYF